MAKPFSPIEPRSWPNRYMTTTEVAAKLHIPKATVLRIATKHQVPRHTVGPCKMFDRDGQERIYAAVLEEHAARQQAASA